MSDWQESQHHDELVLQEAGMEALLKAHKLGLDESECMALAYMAGIANDFYKEVHK